MRWWLRWNADRCGSGETRVYAASPRRAGRCAVDGGSAVISAVQALFAATTGDEQHDRVVRTTMVDVLEEAVSPETLRDVLPITWSALLHPDQAVRSAGIDLWVACADVADALPAELIELSEALLQDRYVLVHRRMLQQNPRLHVPAEVATRLLPIVATWVITYEQAGEPDALALALWALRSLLPPASTTTFKRPGVPGSPSPTLAGVVPRIGSASSLHGGRMSCALRRRGPRRRSRRRQARS